MADRHGVWKLLGSLILAASMWYYIFFIWAPRGQHLSDIYASWYATRELFLHGRDPYSPGVTHEIQDWVYSGFEKHIPRDLADHDHQFVYPPFVCFVLWPTMKFSYSQAQWVILLSMVVMTMLSVRWWSAAVHWHPPAILLVVATILVLSQCGIVQGLWYRQLGLLAATFLAAATAALLAGRLTLAGVLLAMSTVKPHLTFLAVAWLLLWALADWRLRRSLIWGFVGAGIVLIAVSTFVVPHWPSELVAAMRAYPRYNPNESILDMFFRPTLGRTVAVAAVGVLTYFCFRMRHVSQDSPAFILILSLVLSSTLVVLPTIAPHGHVVLVLPALALLSPGVKFCRASDVYRLASFSAWAMVGFQSISALLLTITALLSSPDAARKFWIWPFTVSPLLPIAFSIALALAIAGAVDEDARAPVFWSFRRRRRNS